MSLADFRDAMPRWWHSRKGAIGMVAVVGYFAALMMKIPIDEHTARLVEVVVVALFITANGEKK